VERDSGRNIARNLQDKVVFFSASSIGNRADTGGAGTPLRKGEERSGKLIANLFVLCYKWRMVKRHEFPITVVGKSKYHLERITL